MNVFTDLDNLMTLNLDSNQISTLKDVQFSPKLDKLLLRFNLMSNLNEINSTSLSKLHISKNRVQEIKLILLVPYNKFNFKMLNFIFYFKPFCL
jgi:Leucine-rich repeat (LRR) protein